jgi:exo-beta-1,3-glucanase (GH17 family)
MQPSLVYHICVTVSLMVLGMVGCTGEKTGLVPRPLIMVSEDRWYGNGICYGPHRDGQRPGGDTPTADQIREDLNLMAQHWSLVRTYGSSEFAGVLLEEIRRSGLEIKVMLGAWIAAEETRDEHGVVTDSLPEAAAANGRECAAAIALSAAYPDIVQSICVGNETQVFWSPNPLPLELLVEKIRFIRAAVDHPVTTADDFYYWLDPESKTLAQEIDFVTVHAHPLWNGKLLEEAMPWLREQLTGIAAMHPERLIVIGETGWATSVAEVGEEARLIRARPNEADQAVFFRAVTAWAAAERVPIFFFEAFDENWKGGVNPAEVEKHWGLFRADRTAKAAVLHE